MPDFNLKGKTALVTGASSGIGEGIAMALGEQGMNVLVNYLNRKEQAQNVLNEIQVKGGKGAIYQADVSKADAVKDMFAYCENELGPIDVLINNAGIQKDAAFHDLTLDDWNKVIEVNLTGQFLCAQEAVKHFLERDENEGVRGNIIFMSSVHQLIPWAGHVNYASSKGGVMLMMQSIAQEYGNKKIRANAIAPGAIKTNINKEEWEDPASAEKIKQLIPYNRLGVPEDVANVAVWLASNYSQYITGTTIYVDGGMCLYPGFIGSG